MAFLLQILHEIKNTIIYLCKKRLGNCRKHVLKVKKFQKD